MVFSLSASFFSFGSFIYLRYADTIYETNATLQVKDAASDPLSLLTENASPMFNFGRTKIDNYIAQIYSNTKSSRGYQTV